MMEAFPFTASHHKGNDSGYRYAPLRGFNIADRDPAGTPHTGGEIIKFQLDHFLVGISETQLGVELFTREAVFSFQIPLALIFFGPAESERAHREADRGGAGVGAG